MLMMNFGYVQCVQLFICFLAQVHCFKHCGCIAQGPACFVFLGLDLGVGVFSVGFRVRIGVRFRFGVRVEFDWNCKYFV